MLSDVQAVLGACRVGKSQQLAQDLNYRRAGELPPLLLHPLCPDRPSDSGGTHTKDRFDFWQHRYVIVCHLSQSSQHQVLDATCTASFNAASHCCFCTDKLPGDHLGSLHQHLVT